MPSEKICKTIHQHNKEPVSAADMQKLLEIAENYRKVKNYVYARFDGIASLGKIYPGYSVQNEMTASGYRETLGMPSVYFYLAIFDALGDIKCQWTRTKTKILKLINQNEGFSEENRHYLRFVIKVPNAFEAVLNQKMIKQGGQKVLGQGKDEPGELVRRQVQDVVELPRAVLGSSCIYLRMAPQPITESCLLTGELEKTNEAYALAKISGLKYCEFLNRQYRTDYISVMPTNLYGPNDNYHPTDSHVLPALIRRFHEAKVNHLAEVTCWGGRLSEN